MQKSVPTSYLFWGFKFYTEKGELWRGNTRIHLHPQTAELLGLFLMNPGEVVAREQVRQTLWPGQEKIDHEKAINNAISRLRTALRDDPRNPWMIERVPRRGYRLLGTVEAQLEASALLPLASAEELPAETAMAHAETTPNAGTPLALERPPDSVLPKPPYLRRFHGLASSNSSVRRQRLFLIGGLVSITALLVIAYLSWGRYEQYKSAHTTISLGLAPFETDSPAAAAVADGFRFDLVEALYRLPNVRLHAFRSMNSASMKDALTGQQARDLGLDDVLFGRITRNGDECSFTFHLVRSRDSKYLATFRYSGTPDDLGAIRDRVQRDLYHQLNLSGDTAETTPGGTVNAEAYEAYLRASYDFSQQKDEALRSAVTEYSDAIARDPHFAKAYTGLARTYLVMRSHGLMANEDAFNKAGSNVAAALRINPDLAEVHALLGLILFYHDWKLAAGEQEERRAIQLDPNEALFHQWLALLLNDQGKYAEALRELNTASSNDPYWPPVLISDIFVSGNAHEWDRMLARATKLKEITPDSTLALDAMANALWYSKRYVDAIEQWREMAVREGDSYRVHLEDAGLAAYRRDGIKGYAKLRLQAIHDPSYVPRHPNDFQDSEWDLWSGNPAGAVQALQTLMERHDPEFLDVARSQIFDSVRTDAAYSRILVESGLAERQH